MIFSRCCYCRCFGLLLRRAEASAGIITPPNSAWREIDGRWLCPLCYWWVYYWQGAQGISSTAHSQQGSPDPVLSIPMRPLAESKKAGPRGLAVEEREVTLPPPCRGRHRRGQMRTAYGISRAPRRIIERDQLGREQRGVDDQCSVAGCGFAASSMASASFGSRAAMTPYSSSRRTGHMASNECLMRSTCSGVMM